MLSFKEYADQHRITYESVRKQVSRYKKELAGHITKQNRKQYLDDYAVNFLNERRNTNTVYVLNEDVKTEAARNEELQEENKKLLYKIAQLQDQLNQVEREKQQGIEAAAKLQLIEASNEKLEAKNEELITKVAQLEQDKRALEKECDSYVPSIFGFFRKKIG